MIYFVTTEATGDDGSDSTTEHSTWKFLNFHHHSSIALVCSNYKTVYETFGSNRIFLLQKILKG